MKSGYQIIPEFVVVQHSRDRQILENLKKYFKCGYIKTNHGDRLSYTVRNISHLTKLIIPFFEKHKLKTRKRLDFEKFRQAVHKMEQGDHLTNQGFKEIQKIVQEMRKFSRSDETKQRLCQDLSASFEDQVQPLSQVKAKMK